MVNRKLSDTQVRSIKSWYTSNKDHRKSPAKILAGKHGVSKSTIFGVLSKRHYRTVK